MSCDTSSESYRDGPSLALVHPQPGPDGSPLDACESKRTTDGAVVVPASTREVLTEVRSFVRQWASATAPPLHTLPSFPSISSHDLPPLGRETVSHFSSDAWRGLHVYCFCRAGVAVSKRVFVAPLRRRLLTSLTRLGIWPVFALGHLLLNFTLIVLPRLTLRRMALVAEVPPQSSSSPPFTW